MSLSSIVSSGTSSRATTRNSTSYGSSTSAASSTHSGNAHTASPTSTSHSSSRASSSSHSLSSTHAPAAHSSVGAGQQFSASLQNTVQSQSASQSHVVSSRQSSARAATVSRTSSTSASTRAKWTASASGSKPVNGGPIGVQSSTGSIVESSTYQVVTMYTTAVESNRVYVTITSTSFQAGLTAFPVSGNESVASGRSSFFSNTDAVAGVFLVIGIVFALLAGLLLCVLRRRRRKNGD
ncbi:hypothetical protein NEOLEDRAFT_17942 [Neolentinus lepideus HHB14362 ss-1]|uniref:Uncharacterized protein n=1 Tax=Neolentinus lepideus HHB14362 ss-1 TaxID=1314782 RepID=A0A165W230_9AGAM|nr:hypothetical protein NEOLEDRAFT_17942 [Neolentinus lepideus HHB14362 ss-1]